MKTDLNKNSKLYFNIGLLVSLMLVNMAFQWEVAVIEKPPVDLEDEEAPIWIDPVPTVHVPKPPKPEIPKPAPTPASEIVESEEVKEILEEIEPEPVPDDFSEIILETPEPPTEKTDEVFVFVESQPEPVGGLSAFYNALSKEIKYPRFDKRAGNEGKVYVRFIIEKDGSFSNLEVLKGVSPSIDAEALRALAEVPKWKPGKQRGNPVRVRMVIPIDFQLN